MRSEQEAPSPIAGVRGLPLSHLSSIRRLSASPYLHPGSQKPHLRKVAQPLPSISSSAVPFI